MALLKDVAMLGGKAVSHTALRQKGHSVNTMYKARGKPRDMWPQYLTNETGPGHSFKTPNETFTLTPLGIKVLTMDGIIVKPSAQDYELLESRGETAPLPLPKTGFSFKARASKKVKTAKAMLSEKELDLDLRHNLIQEALSQRLATKYGEHNVSTEQPSGVGTVIDIVVKMKDEYWFYEIKTALTARACLREAIGQLLEYGFWPGAQEPTRIIVVGESPLDKEGQDYLSRLRKRFSLPIEYEAIVI